MATEAPITVKSIRVNHLGGTSIGYALPNPIVGSKATLILIPPFSTTAQIFKPQLTNPELLAAVNLVVLEPIGQGLSKTKAPAFSAWDIAFAFLQAMEALTIKKAFVLGESMGGWIAARMALYAPQSIQGLIPIVSTLDNTGPSLIDTNVLQHMANLNPLLGQLLVPAGSAFSNPGPSEQGITSAIGPSANIDQKKALIAAIGPGNAYSETDGREKLRQATIASMTRDSLLSRIADIKCPVLWIAASADPFADTAGVAKEIGLFTSDVRFETIKFAFHLPTWTHAPEVHNLVIEFVKKYSGVRDARALREAVGMVDI